jgi:hypothetical protein
MTPDAQGTTTRRCRMPAYSFKRQFVGAVEAGDKLHTIRGKRKARPKAGQRFVAYYGMRTRQCRKLLDSVITKVQDIRIEHSNLQLPGFWSGLYPRITVDGECLRSTRPARWHERTAFLVCFT